MRLSFLSLLFLSFPAMSLCQSCKSLSVPKAPVDEALFDNFYYQGNDDIYNKNKLTDASQFYNPILPGFYPDPSITTNGKGDYYLATSTFTFFPGVPLFHSRDLVNWEQVGHILDRESQMENMKGQHVSGGIFAPALSYNPKTGTYYMITTNVGAGNFYVKTPNPEGAWSDPIHLPSILGIDPSIFIDDDGRAYVVNNDDAPDNKPEYPGHRTVRVQELDLATDKCVGERKIIINKGCRPEEKPIWCEAPHIYKIKGKYYLMTAEGGTSDWHSEVIYRSESVWGPYEPYSGNPILTQRTLAKDRKDPVTCAGHADLVKTENGEWWAVFLACRPVKDNWENLGRETFMMPVSWTEDGWPMMTGSTGLVPQMLNRNGVKRNENVTFGNFKWEDDFSSDVMKQDWVTLRTSAKGLFTPNKYNGWLSLKKQPVTAEQKDVPSLVARRLQHHKFEASTTMRFQPSFDNDAAGIMLFKDEKHQLLLVRTLNAGKQTIELQQVSKDGKKVLASQPCKLNEVELKITSTGTTFEFFYKAKKDWVKIGDAPAQQLSTQAAGGFTGTVVALYCTGKEAKK